MRKKWSKYIIPLFLTTRWNAAIIACVVLFVCRFFLTWLGVLPYLALLVFIVLFLFDYFLLFSKEKGVFAARSHAERFSNGDENPVRIDIRNNYPFEISADIIDEIPFQFQRRDVLFKTALNPGKNVIVNYELRPVKRGEYEFGSINVFVSSAFSFVKRRYHFEQPAAVPVYPSYIQMRKYQLMAISNRLNEVGVKKIRRLGHSMEFEQV